MVDEPLLAVDESAERLIRVLGASTGLGEFLQRRPAELESLREPLPPTGTAARPTTNASAGDESVASEA